MPQGPKGKGKKTDKASVKKSPKISQSDHTQAENATKKLKEMETEKLRKIGKRESIQKAGWWFRIPPLAWFLGFLALAFAVLGWWATGFPSPTPLDSSLLPLAVVFGSGSILLALVKPDSEWFYGNSTIPIVGFVFVATALVLVGRSPLVSVGFALLALLSIPTVAGGTVLVILYIYCTTPSGPSRG
jgi:hypothetical protein